MSHTTHSSALRTLAGAGLLAAAALAAPTTSHAQSRSEVALMNHLAPTVFIPNAFAFGSGAEFPVVPDAVDGEKALLGRTSVAQAQGPDATSAEVASGSVSGAYALLGRSSPLDARRETSLDESR